MPKKTTGTWGVNITINIFGDVVLRIHYFVVNKVSLSEVEIEKESNLLLIQFLSDITVIHLF